jgi:holo-[acyl-carrier protein] synthase
MTLRNGIDLLEISRLQAAIERQGERFLARVFTPLEREICTGNLSSLAARFAAKEAVAKALGTGLGSVAWTDIEILRADSGAPLLRLHNRASSLAEQLGLREWSVSLSHTHDYAIAMVVATGEADQSAAAGSFSSTPIQR